MTSLSTAAGKGLALDESSFQQLLAAAYVVQQHSEKLSAKSLQLEATRVLSELAEMQPGPNRESLDLAAEAKRITEKLLNLVSASGVSLSLISNGYLDCVAESGVPAKLPGSSLASHSLVATERLKAGEIFDSPDSRSDIRLDTSLCRQLAVRSLVAAPVFRFGELAGLIEVRWTSAGAFNDAALLACRLMGKRATQILEASARPAQVDVREKPNAPASVFNESPKATVLTSLPGEENLSASEPVEKPVIESATTEVLPKPRSSEEPCTTPTLAPDSVPESSASTSPDGPIQSTTAAVNSPVERCRVCGRPFGSEEAFCGHCSMPRTEASASQELQSKWASLWFIQQAQVALAGEQEKDEIGPANEADSQGHISSEKHSQPGLQDSKTSSDRAEPADLVAASPSSSPEIDSHFSFFKPRSEELARDDESDFLAENSWWSRFLRIAKSNLRAKDAVLILVATMLTVGVVSAWPRSNGQLTWFGSIVVRLGLAHQPVHRFVSAGNPDITVWVDDGTSLYYCPGADLYGKTSEGHFAAQSDAQERHAQPASGLVCQ